jgi:hypothetical protein
VEGLGRSRAAPGREVDEVDDHLALVDRPEDEGQDTCGSHGTGVAGTKLGSPTVPKPAPLA